MPGTEPGGGVPAPPPPGPSSRRPALRPSGPGGVRGEPWGAGGLRSAPPLRLRSPPVLPRRPTGLCHPLPHEPHEEVVHVPCGESPASAPTGPGPAPCPHRGPPSAAPVGLAPSGSGAERTYASGKTPAPGDLEEKREAERCRRGGGRDRGRDRERPPGSHRRPPPAAAAAGRRRRLRGRRGLSRAAPGAAARGRGRSAGKRGGERGRGPPGASPTAAPTARPYLGAERGARRRGGGEAGEGERQGQGEQGEHRAAPHPRRGGRPAGGVSSGRGRPSAPWTARTGARFWEGKAAEREMGARGQPALPEQSSKRPPALSSWGGCGTVGA